MGSEVLMDIRGTWPRSSGFRSACAVEPWRLARFTNKCDMNSSSHLNLAVYHIIRDRGGTPVGDQCPKDNRELIIGCTEQELLATSTCFWLIPPISSRVFHKQATKLNGHPPVFNCLPSYILHSSFKRGSKNKATRPTNI